MQRLLASALLSSVLGLSYGVSQQYQAGQWKSFTDMKSVSVLHYSSGRVLAATGGGMFAYDVNSKTYTTWTNADNLSSNSLTALMVDKANRIWVGSSGGAIDVFDQTLNTWQSIQDIATNSTHPQKAIRGFLGKGDTVYVVADFGMSVFLVSRWAFGDTYASFGFSTQPTVTATAVLGNQIFIGTDLGVAVASLSSPNLSDPSWWVTYGSPQGLSSNAAVAMATYHDTLLVGTQIGIYYFTGNSFQLVGGSAGQNVVAIIPGQAAYSYVWNDANRFVVESSVQVLGNPQIVAVKDSSQATSLDLDPGSSTLYVGTTDQGIAVWKDSGWTLQVPNGPQSNLFTSLSVDSKGVLWAASGFGGNGEGFYRFDASLPVNEQWKNFTAAADPILKSLDPTQTSNDYYKTSVGANGSMWVSSWGDGIVEIKSDTIRRKLTSTSTLSLAATVATNPLFVVVGGVAVDLQGASWMTNRTAVNGNYLAELINDTTFQYVRCTAIPCSGFFSAIVIDQNGTKWMANAEPTQKSITGPVGLYYYNENLTVAGTESTGGWGMMTTSDGLPNDVILSLAVDQDNNVWVGTDLGITIITNPQNPRSSMISSFPLREQSIQAIAVDGLNDKWIGTEQGVFVVNADGTQLLNQYTVINTGGKLVDDNIRSIAIDQRRGIAYIGTQNGLSSIQIPAVQPLQTYTKLEFGPNPYTLPNTEPLIISNLVANSTVKILSVSGTLVVEFAAQGGGRAFWDGRDRRGNYVSTGIYFVVAYADNGNQLANGKVAVVRK